MEKLLKEWLENNRKFTETLFGSMIVNKSEWSICDVFIESNDMFEFKVYINNYLKYKNLPSISYQKIPEEFKKSLRKNKIKRLLEDEKDNI